MRKPASQGRKLANKKPYTDVSDRRLQVKLTQKAKIATGFSGQYPKQRTKEKSGLLS